MSLLVWLVGYLVVARFSTILALICMLVGFIMAIAKQSDERKATDKITICLTFICVVYLLFSFIFVRASISGILH
ncbi:MAG: hypothetical protein IKG27_04710 [Bacilli bacterium]|nr:hypothetical protein [Bacilli bacterium]